MANIEALNQLIRVVRETPDHEFDMNQWSCGTVGCALGRAAMDSYFIDRGLRLKTRSGIPEYGADNVGCSAGMCMFDIEWTEAVMLFSPGHYVWDEWSGAKIKQETVIARIQHLIDHYTLQRDAHVRTYRAAQTVAKIIEQALVDDRETV